MKRLDQEVLNCAERVVQMSRDRAGQVLDYTDSSIDLVEEMLAEAAAHARRMTEERLRRLSQDVGCYVLEVAHRNHGGAYVWADDRNEPGLCVGEPHFALTLFCWDKVYARLRGGPTVTEAEQTIPPFYAGFVARVRQAKPGERVVFL
jgi:hypothetical protein